MLHLTSPDGRSVAVLPLAVGAVIDEVPGVLRSQLIQTGPSALTLSLDVPADVEPQRVWDQACTALADYLEAQGLTAVTILRGKEVPPQLSTASGKYRQVIAAPAQSTPDPRPPA